MKKSLFFALAVAGMLAGCSSNESFDGDSYTEVNQDADYSKVPIQIGVSRIASLDVRGTGTVGDVTGGANNVWKGQLINVLMFERGTLNLAIKDKELDKNPIYNRVAFATPNGSISAIATDTTSAINYYPQKGNFDFWGYRLDGADTVYNAQQPVPTVIPGDEYTYGYTGDTLKLDFTIDGTQDVMIAKAKQGEAIPGAADSAANARAFSAYSARNGVQPELIFKHLLTRLNFKVVAGDANAVGDNDPTNPANTGIWVKAIGVKSKATGKLIAAYNKATEEANDTLADNERIEWIATLDTLTLRSRDGVNPNTNLLDTLTYTQPESTTTPTQLGDAILVAPANQYEIIITLLQDKPVVSGGANVRNEFTVPATITRNGGFLLGHSYNVTITLYGMQQIEITTTLTGWENGGNIDITPEDNIE